MGSVDNVQVNTAIGLDGQAITTSISNDKLTNEDFMMILLEQLKMQDPTKPMDSAQMLQDQMQMSQIETNIATQEAMANMVESFQETAISNSANMIGTVVENGNVDDTGASKGYFVQSINIEDGEIYLQTREVTAINDDGSFTLSDTKTAIPLSSVLSVTA
jgi:flagellar basal-body rod modification protein FlgD